MMGYAIVPFITWLIAGSLKFVINSIRTRKLAFGLVGYGGLPSNHSAIVSSMAALIAFHGGMNTPAFGVAITVAFIVLLDANSLRRQIGKQAEAINSLRGTEAVALRERMGHSKIEIGAGILVGIVSAYVLRDI